MEHCKIFEDGKNFNYALLNVKSDKHLPCYKKNFAVIILNTLLWDITNILWPYLRVDILFLSIFLNASILI